MDKKFKCYLVNGNYGSGLYVEGLDIIISFRSLKIDDKKMKSVRKLLSRIKKAGIFRVMKSSVAISIEKRAFEIQHQDIIELLDEQGYEVRG